MSSWQLEEDLKAATQFSFKSLMVDRGQAAQQALDLKGAQQLGVEVVQQWKHDLIDNSIQADAKR